MRRSETLLIGGVFLLSGISALVFQVAWQRILTTHYGVGAISTMVIVSVFLFGLGSGSLLGGWLADRLKRLARLYVVLEAAIALFGVASPWLIDWLGSATRGADYGLMVLLTSALLVPPTVAMGATLPVLVKLCLQRDHRFLETVGRLYALNTAGAALGALLSSFVLVSFLGLDRAIWIASANSLLLALLVARFIRPLARAAGSAQAPAARTGMALLPWPVWVVFATGFIAIGLEIVWFRMISVLVKSSPYALSSGLAVFLAGLALGSWWAARCFGGLGEEARRNRFFQLNLLIAAWLLLSVAGYYLANEHTPLRMFTIMSFGIDVHPQFLPDGIETGLDWIIAVFRLVDVLFWPVVLFLPPTVLMGAAFPLAAALAHDGEDREGRTVAMVYSANILGNVAGGLCTGLLLLPALGSSGTLFAFLAVGSLFAFGVRHWFGRRQTRWRQAGVAVAIALPAAVLFPGDGALYRTMHLPGALAVFQGLDGKAMLGAELDPEVRVLTEEGVDAVIVTYLKGDRLLNYLNGLAHGTWPGTAYRSITRDILAYTPRAARVLVIGYGAGTTSATLLQDSRVADLRIVEISGSLVRNLRKTERVDRQLADPRVSVVIEDARRYLYRSAEKFDLVVMDPLRSTTAYSNNIYSREFMALVREHLADGGVLAVRNDAGAMIPATAGAVFDHVAICRQGFLVLASDRELRRHDAVQPSPELCAAETLAAFLARYPEPAPVLSDLRPTAEYFLGPALMRPEIRFNAWAEQ